MARLNLLLLVCLFVFVSFTTINQLVEADKTKPDVNNESQNDAEPANSPSTEGKQSHHKFSSEIIEIAKYLQAKKKKDNSTRKRPEDTYSIFELTSKTWPGTESCGDCECDGTSKQPADGQYSFLARFQIRRKLGYKSSNSKARFQREQRISRLGKRSIRRHYGQKNQPVCPDYKVKNYSDVLDMCHGVLINKFPLFSLDGNKLSFIIPSDCFLALDTRDWPCLQIVYGGKDDTVSYVKDFSLQNYNLYIENMGYLSLVQIEYGIKNTRDKQPFDQLESDKFSPSERHGCTRRGLGCEFWRNVVPVCLPDINPTEVDPTSRVDVLYNGWVDSTREGPMHQIRLEANLIKCPLEVKHSIICAEIKSMFIPKKKIPDYDDYEFIPAYRKDLNCITSPEHHCNVLPDKLPSGSPLLVHHKRKWHVLGLHSKRLRNYTENNIFYFETVLISDVTV